MKAICKACNYPCHIEVPDECNADMPPCCCPFDSESKKVNWQLINGVYFDNDTQEIVYGVVDKAVDHPSHYAEGRKYEPIDVIEDWELGFNLGNAVKYISRAGRKDDLIQDLEKARWYLEREIQRLKK